MTKTLVKNSLMLSFTSGALLASALHAWLAGNHIGGAIAGAIGIGSAAIVALVLYPRLCEIAGEKGKDNDR